MKIYYNKLGRFVKATGDGIFKESENVNTIQFKFDNVPNDSVVLATFLLPFPQSSSQYGNYSAQSLLLTRKVDEEEGGYLWESEIPGGYLVNNGTAYISARVNLPLGTITITENPRVGNDRSITIGTTTYEITYSSNYLVLTAGDIVYTANSETSIIVNNKIYLIAGDENQLQLIGGLKVKTMEQVQFLIENSGEYVAEAVLPELGEQILYELARLNTKIINADAEIDDLWAELALKQDKADDTLETDQKTVVGAINELNTELEGTEEHPEAGLKARVTQAEADIDAIEIEQDTQNDNISTNAGNITNLQGRVGDLENIVGSGEQYIGTYSGTYDPYVPAQLAELKPLLTQYVIDHSDQTEPVSGDVIIYVQQITGTDKNFKFIYSKPQTDWTFYEIPPAEKADDNTYGILKGTENSSYNTKVHIEDGEILDIKTKNRAGQYKSLHTYLQEEEQATEQNTTDINDPTNGLKKKVADNTNNITALNTEVNHIKDGTTVVPKATQAQKDGLNRQIDETYLTVASGATKQELIDYALPREFNDVSYVGAENQYTETIPDTINPLYTATSSQIGDTQLFYVEKTIQNAEFQLGNKNSYTTNLYLTASIDCTVAYRVITQLYHNGAWTLLNAELTDPVDMVAGIIKKVNFGSPFNLLTSVVNVESGDKIRQIFEVQTETSTSITFNIYSNSTYPSTFYLNTTAQTIIVSQGYLGELPYYNLSGVIDNNKLVFTLGADVQVHENVVGIFKLNYTGTIPANTPIVISHNSAELRIVTPYNYTTNADATIETLDQVYTNSTGLLFTGVFKTVGGDLSVLALLDNLTGVKEELINSAVFKALTPSSTTLTEAELTTLQNNNCVLTTELNISSTILSAGTILTKPFEYSGTLRGLYINNSKIGTYLVTISTRTIGAGAQDIVLNNLAQLNGKAIPSYPSSTGTFIFEMVDGTLTWTANPISFKKIAVPSSTTLTDDEINKIIIGCQIDGNFLNLIRPTLFPAREIAGSVYRGVMIGYLTNGNAYVGMYEINKGTKVISQLAQTNNLVDLRSIANIYMGNYTINIDQFGQLQIGNANVNSIQFDGSTVRSQNLVPMGNNQKDLGSSSLKWKDLYLTGNLTDGTVTIAVANIATLTDLANIKTIKAEVVQTLPTASSTTYFNESKTIYLVPVTNGSGTNYYDEYITTRSGTEGSYTYTWELVGNTQIDLSGYLQKDTTHTNRLYGTGSEAGVQMMWVINQDGTVGDAICQRDAYGSVVVPTPTENGQATPKSYVDGLVGDINTILTTLNSGNGV